MKNLLSTFPQNSKRLSFHGCNGLRILVVGLCYLGGLMLTSFAQQIEGIIYDVETQRPLNGVQINHTSLPYQTITDSLGRYRLRLPQGRHEIQFKLKGYASTSRSVMLRDAVPLIVSLGLDPLGFFLHQGPIHTASVTPSDPLDQPHAYSILTETQLDMYQVRSVPEGLDQLIGLWQASPSLGISAHRLRGWSNRRQVWLLEGIRLLYSPGAYGLNGLDPQLIKRIEVAKNTGSVLHGGGAVGGSIHMIGSSGAYSPGGFTLRGRGRVKYMGGDMEQRLRGELSIATPRTFIRLGSSWKRFGDRIAAPPLGIQSPSAYEELNLDFQYRYRLSKQDELTLALVHSEQTGVDNLEQVSQNQFTQWELTPRISTLAYIRWLRKGQGPIPSQWKITTSVQRREEARSSQLIQDPRTYRLENELNRAGLEIRVTHQWLHNWQSTTGIEAYRDLNQSTGLWRDSLANQSGRAITLLPNGAMARQVALFSMHELRTRRWLIVGGVRMQLQQMLGVDFLGDSLSSLFTPISGHLGVNYRVAPAQRAYAKIETGARLPQWYEWEQSASLPNSLVLPQPTLEPETFVHLEVGYKVRQANWALSVAGFQTLLRGAIELVPATLNGASLYEGRNLFKYQNLHHQRVVGGEVELSSHIGAWRPYLGLTYAEGIELSDPKDPIAGLPPLNGRWGIRYQQASFYFMLEGSAAAAPNRLSTMELMQPELLPDKWITLHAYAGYKTNWFTFRAGALNLLDQSYRYHGSILGAYGRTFWANLDLPIGSQK